MAMFKLRPAHTDYLWGGTRLREEFGKQIEGIVAETWELSIHPDGLSTIVAPGSPYDCRPITDYLRENPHALGKEGKLPILIKFIDAAKDLSIQVHPDDEYGLKHENQFGKTECWYIMDAEPGSTLYYGVKKPMTREEYRKAIADDTILSLLNAVPVKKGDFFFIPAGTIHAIGAGILIAEIQQNSNITYRVHDFNRRDANGNLRELHIEKAIAVSDLTPSSTDLDFGGHLCQCKYFTVDKINVSGSMTLDPATFAGQKSFHSLLVLEGNGSIDDGRIRLGVKKGDSLFVSADHPAYRAEGDFMMLLTTLGK